MTYRTTESIMPRNQDQPATLVRSINDLPDELLLLIFEHGCDDLSVGDSKPDKCTHRSLHPFIVPVIATCSHWRSISSPAVPNTRFYLTRAILDSNYDTDYNLMLAFVEFRRTLLTSPNSRLYVWLVFIDGKDDLFCTRLRMHAIFLAFQRSQWLRQISGTMLHLRLADCFVAELLSTSTSQTFTWQISCLDNLRSHFITTPPSYIYDTPFIDLGFAFREVQNMIDLEGDSSESYTILGAQVHRAEIQTIMAPPYLYNVLKNFAHLAVLVLGSPIITQAQEGRLPNKINLPFLHTLMLEKTSSEQARALFLLLDLPRLWRLEIDNEEEIYPIDGVTLPIAIEIIVCRSPALNDQLYEFRSLKEKLSFQPASEVIKVNEDIYTCRMESTRANDYRKPWHLSLYGTGREVAASLEDFRDTFRQTLRNSPGGVWLEGINSCIRHERKKWIENRESTAWRRKKRQR